MATNTACYLTAKQYNHLHNRGYFPVVCPDIYREETTCPNGKISVNYRRLEKHQRRDFYWNKKDEMKGKPWDTFRKGTRCYVPGTCYEDIHRNFYVLDRNKLICPSQKIMILVDQMADERVVVERSIVEIFFFNWPKVSSRFCSAISGWFVLPPN